MKVQVRIDSVARTREMGECVDASTSVVVSANEGERRNEWAFGTNWAFGNRDRACLERTDDERALGDAQELREELEKRGLDSSGLKNQLVERLEEALGVRAETGAEEELEDVPDVEVSAADAAKIAALDKKEPEAGNKKEVSKTEAPKKEVSKTEVPKTEAPTKEVPKPKKTEAEHKAEQDAEKKKANETFVADLKRRKERAEKFGLPFAMNEQERARVRSAGAAKAFGLDDAAPEVKKENKPAEKSEEQKKKEKEAFDAKLKARAERFGDALKPLPKPTPIYQPTKRANDAAPEAAAKKAAQ